LDVTENEKLTSSKMYNYRFSVAVPQGGLLTQLPMIERECIVAEAILNCLNNTNILTLWMLQKINFQ